LLNVINKNDKYIAEGLFEKYDMIILDESESLLNHFDEKTMENKEIEIFNFFDMLLTHTNKIMMMDGDISKRSLSFAEHYGNCTYIKNMNHDGSKVLNIYLDEDQWTQQLEGI
jgi:hypothetical protein